MVAGSEAHGTASTTSERAFPPISEVCIATMILVIIGGTYISAYLPKQAPLALPYALLAGATLLLVFNAVQLARLNNFAWDKFKLVAAWSFGAYIIIGGMLEYVFLYDHTPGRLMVVLSCMLAIYAIDIPILFAFSVARYAERPSAGR